MAAKQTANWTDGGSALVGNSITVVPWVDGAPLAAIKRDTRRRRANSLSPLAGTLTPLAR
jgi:hypothetical protein